ncbi:MAG: RNA polymerase sigma factor [Chlorobi bacterium]|nr:RNA polymerase sigma factor [Chlorobiota bacterium]
MGTRDAATAAEVDRQLVERVLAKDPTVIEDIVRTYKRLVYHLALELCRNHDDAEDLVQEVFVRAWKSLDTFRGDARLSTWLHRITVNLFINMRRSRSAQFHSEQESFDEEYMTGGRDTEFDPEQMYHSQQIQADIEQALNKLSPAQRAVFVLRHYHGLSIKEIAEHMHNTDGTVKVLLFRAIRNLQRYLSFYRDDFGNR